MRGSSKQHRHSGGEEQPISCHLGAGGHRRECLLVDSAQVLDVLQQRKHHLVKPGEGEGTFELSARHPEHARAIMPRPRYRCGQQRCLAHARFPRHEQRATITVGDTSDEVPQDLPLVLAPDQGAGGGTGRHHQSPCPSVVGSNRWIPLPRAPGHHL